MNDSSLYILLTETSRENDDFDYWLQTIQLYGKESPILFVQNKRNGMPRSLDISHYKNNFNIKEGLFNVNLLNNEGLGELENAIQYHIQKLPHTQRTIPRSWLGIREALDKLKVDSGGYITFEKFREVCREQDITERAKIEDVGQFLHRLGVVLWYKDNAVLRQKIILERHWATEGIFKLVFNEEIQKAEGHFSFAQAQALWDENDTYCYHTNDLIELMREFKICFPRKSQPDQYIIPALLTATAPQVDWLADTRMTVEYHYPTILPRGLINYLTAEMYDDIRDDAHAWSAGVWLHTGDSQAKIEENRFHRKIRITLSGAQHREMFGGIKKVIDNIHKDYPGMEPELRIPCICETCLNLPQNKKNYYKYDKIVERLEGGKRTVECDVKPYNDVPVEKLLNHILRREDYDATYRRETKDKAKRIFVSYSHKDMAYREELENRLKPLLRQQKIDDLWYDHKIMPGADWAAEIERNLRSADIIILLISDDFWASDYIDEKELPIVQARYEDSDCVVIPIIVRANSYWEDSKWSRIQAVPTDKQTGKLTPISQWNDKDEAWKNIVEGIRTRI